MTGSRVTASLSPRGEAPRCASPRSMRWRRSSSGKRWNRLLPTCAKREAEMLRAGYPAYTTSAGWLGYSDEKLRKLCREAVAQGWTHVKMKVGTNLDDDVRRARIVREEIGSERHLMMDANQVWEVGEAITNMKLLAEFNPYWIEEPTSPDDVLGHATIARAIAPIKVATGEHCQ